jgi:hypothetical protein
VGVGVAPGIEVTEAVTEGPGVGLDEGVPVATEVEVGAGVTVGTEVGVDRTGVGVLDEDPPPIEQPASRNARHSKATDTNDRRAIMVFSPHT